MDADAFLTAWRERLRDRLRDTGTRSGDVAAALHLSESSLRKRFRGEVPFSAGEFVTLCDAYDLPRGPRDLGDRRFGFRAIEAPSDGFSEAAYVEGLTGFSRVLLPDGRDGSAVSFRACASDLPIHRLLGDPVLMAVKFYFFRTRNGVAIAERFDLAAARETHADALAKAARIHDEYAATDSVEVWGRNPIGSFLHQIKKLAWAHALNAPDLAEVFARLRALADAIGAEADAGKKAGGGAFRLYQNRVFTNNAIFLAEAPGQRHTFLTVANPHYLHSDDPETFAFFEATVEALREQSEHVGASGTLDGTHLTRALRRDIDRVEEAIATYWRAEAMF